MYYLYYEMEIWTVKETEGIRAMDISENAGNFMGEESHQRGINETYA